MFSYNDVRVQVHIRRLLDFFDVKVAGSEGHATAIVAVLGEELGTALLKHYWQSHGSQVDVLPTPCTHGTQKGARLDSWVHVRSADREVLYQVEVKNWSAHAIGGESLAVDAPPDVVAAYKRRCWLKEWDNQTGIKKKQLAKVLEPMSPPILGIPIEPLACMWTALHPTGDEACLFSVDVPSSSSFPRVWFFSMSAYLRSLADTELLLEMPTTVRRLRWLGELVTPSQPIIS